MSPTFEVENKYRVMDLASLQEQLARLNVAWTPVVEQSDDYFAHPSRDFAATDEALRIRLCQSNHWITYKGPKLDQRTKTRHELELPLGDQPGTAAQFHALLIALGFRPVATVSKRRRRGQFPWDRFSITVALDEVDQLGRFVEFEIVVGETDVPNAQQALVDLAEHLRLPDPIRVSYLEMLLQRAE